MDLEICVDSIESAINAEQGGAQRVELCCALSEGGLTPSHGLIRAVRAHISIGLHVMIRPRGGDFVYSPQELDIMQADIAFAKTAGADGIVLGLLTPAAEIDLINLKNLIASAGNLHVTHHRAIDMTCEPAAAIEAIIAAGAHRILTSGGAQTAMLGTRRLAQMVNLAANRIDIMVGGEVRPENVRQLAQETGATQFHAALRTPAESPMHFRNPNVRLGNSDFDDYARFTTRIEDVSRLRQALTDAAST